MKRLEEMTLEELWELFPIILTAPNAEWQVWALEEIANLKKIIGKYISAVQHIGSTAIRGIWAKPIIDILIETDNKSTFPIIKSLMIDSSYICMNESEYRLDFNKGYTPRGFAERVFHIHIRLSGDNDEIYFRNYLNNNPDIAKRYERLKLRLSHRYKHDRDGYTNAKSGFIKYYTAKAKASEQPLHYSPHQ